MSYRSVFGTGVDVVNDSFCFNSSDPSVVILLVTDGAGTAETFRDSAFPNRRIFNATYYERNKILFKEPYFRKG